MPFCGIVISSPTVCAVVGRTHRHRADKRSDDRHANGG